MDTERSRFGPKFIMSAAGSDLRTVFRRPEDASGELRAIAKKTQVFPNEMCFMCLKVGKTTMLANVKEKDSGFSQ